MNKLIVSFLLFSSTAFASLPRGAISNVGVGLYGVYMTGDASCQNSLIAALPLSKNPVSSNFVASPVLGAGSVPAKISCVILVLSNSIQIAWQASAAYPGLDNLCAAGGTAPVNPCVGAPSIVWPAAIVADAKALGLTLATNCSAAPSGTEVVPVFMSVNSSCTGNSNIDKSISGCTALGKSTSSTSQSPVSSNSTSSGARIPLTLPSGRLIFAVDPDQIVSGVGVACSVTSPPVFSIHQ